MVRPNLDPSVFASGLESWDAILRDFLAKIVSTPFPVAQFANFAALPAANTYDRCLACTVDTNKLWFSNGTTWKEVNLL